MILTHPFYACRAKDSCSVYRRMESTYVCSLDYAAQKRYWEKLTFDGEVLPDPYTISEDHWVDDVPKWPNVEFGDLYVYLVDTKGLSTKDKLKAYKSLEAYNYFHNGYVRKVYHYKCESRPLVLLKARVNPSQKSADDNHEAWAIVSKESGSIKAAHCKCMAG